MQAKAVAKESPAFVHSLNGLPLVLMSEGGSASEVWKSIELGAAEYLEKPLSTLKLRNIWQHVVRKVVLIQQQYCGCWHAKHSTQLPFRSMLILYVLTNLWHCLQMMHGCEQEDSSCKLSGRDSAHASTSFLQQVCALDNAHYFYYLYCLVLDTVNNCISSVCLSNTSLCSVSTAMLC